MALLIDQQVLRLQVTVQYTPVVAKGNACEKLV